MPPRRAGLLMLLGATLAWSTAGLFARAIALDTPTVILWRGWAGAAGLLALLLALKGRAGLRDVARLGPLGWAYALFSGLGVLCFVGALKATSIAHVAIIYATLPFIAAGLGWVLLRERPGSAALVAALVALAGSVIMVGLGGDGTWWGDLMALGMALAMAALILIARARPQLPALAAGILGSIWAPAACLPFASLDGVTPQALGMMIAFGLVNSTLAFALFIFGARLVAPVETALMGALEVPVTPLWVWLVFDELPTPATLLGGGLVLAAVVGHILWTALHSERRNL
ncbi:MAG: DMT family transporter [Rhodobacter sp.]|nr:DMT family transporter [Rhodobacter sp.]